MSAARFFTDEDVYGAVADALNRADYDTISTPSANRLGATDDSQLEWATGEGRTLITFNVGHFARLHAEWMRLGREHAGIVVSTQRTVGETTRRLLRIAAELDAASLHNRLEYLGDW